MGHRYYVDYVSPGHTNDAKCELTVLRGHAKFTITAEYSQVTGTPFGKKLLQKVNTSREYQWGKCPPHHNPAQLLYKHCLPSLEEIVPDTTLRDLSLEIFLHAPTYHLRIVLAKDSSDICIEGKDTCRYTPAFYMSPIPITELPALCHALPKFSTKDLQICPVQDVPKALDWIQGAVRTRSGEEMYFKPRYELREPEFERELDILTCIAVAKLPGEIRIPRLLGIVVSKDNDEATICMGMLLSLIPGTHLSTPRLWSQVSLHERWEEQVTSIVRELHANNIVWGDVNPMNVMIDENENAWVVDFGGMNNVEFVDEEKRETIEGDWQGVERLFRSWLVGKGKMNPGLKESMG